MKLSVIICTYDRPELLSRTLDHLSEQTMSDDEFELIAVYEETVRETEVVLDEHEDDFEHFTALPEDPDANASGLAHARNCGLEVAQSEYVLFLDDDVKPSAGLFDAIYETFESVSPEPVCVGGRVVPEFEGEKPTWLPESLPGLPVCRLGNEQRWIEFPEEFVIGATVAFRREFLRQEGGFPTALGRQQGTLLANEELELLRAADEKTGIYYQPEACVDHFIGEERLRVGYFLRRFFWQGVSDCRSERYGHDPRDEFFAPVHVVRAVGSIAKNAVRIFLPGRQSRMMYLLQVAHKIGYVFEESKSTIMSGADYG